MFQVTQSKRTRRRKRLKEVSEILNTIRNGSQEINNPNAAIINVNNCLTLNNNIEIDSLDLDLGSTNPTDNECLSSETEHLNSNLNLELREWKLRYCIKYSALRELLSILPPYLKFNNLPVDPRTLMQTPRNVQVDYVSGGKFVYFGILQGLVKRVKSGLEVSHRKIPFLQKLERKFNNKLITLSIGIDGIPICKSNNNQFWPILGKVDQTLDSTPFVIGIFYNNTKPSNTEFLSNFILDCKSLETEGFVVEQTLYSFRISCILADAPARSFLKGIKNHNSYYSCERCIQKGSWDGRVIYTEFDNTSRTDSSFSARVHNKHYSSIESSIFCKIEIGLVSQVPLDYLHLCCLGVCRKLF
jgi:hypothetical protein